MAIVNSEQVRQYLAPGRVMHPRTREVLADFFQDPAFLEDINVEVRVPASAMCVTCGPEGIWTPHALIKVGSNPSPDQIVIHPEYYSNDTASGIALQGHEVFHAWQRRVIPDFDRRYTEAALETERRGLPPWENPYERPAYLFEQRVRDALLARGYPAALGQELWG